MAAELTDVQKIEALTKEVAAQKVTNETQAKELETAAQIVADLKEQLAAKESGEVKYPTLTVGKHKYELTSGPFTWAGKEVTIETLKENTKLAEELVKEGFGGLVKVAA